MNTRSRFEGVTCLQVAAATLWLWWAAPLFADASHPVGSDTGDGSTPFTGLAQAPEANLFAGAAASEIPILVPPGHRGLTPKLALTYSSSAGSGPYGYGWDLPLGKVQRSTKHGAVRCGAEPDVFVVTLPGSTIECRLDAAQRCLATVEESFLRIEYRPRDDAWEVWDKSGLYYVFGNEASARQPAAPAPGCATFAWHLTRVEDLNGNFERLAYGYDRDSAFLYPERITYGGNARAGSAAPFEVRFVWRAPHACPDGRFASRPCEDRVVNSISGFPIELARLLDRIEVRFDDAIVRAYELLYDIDDSATARRARQSFLTAVTLVDGEGRALSRGDGQPASTTFLYHEPAAAQLGFGTAQSAAKPALENDDALRWTQRFDWDRFSRRDVLDMNGDAIPDLVDTHDGCERFNGNALIAADWDVYLGSADGFATTPLKWSVLAPTLDQDLYCPSLRMSRSNAGGNLWFMHETLDLTGDGVPDLVVTWTWSAKHPFWRVFPGTTPESAGGWGFGEGIDWPAPYAEFRWSKAGQHELGWDGTSDLRDLVDLNGDGLADLVDASQAPWRVWYNTGRGFEAGAPSVFDTSWPLLRFTTDFGLQVAGFADVNGDGLPDQIHAWERYGGAAYPGKWLVRYNHGSGVSAARDWAVPGSGCSWPGNRPWNGLRQSVRHGAGTDDGTDVVRDFFDVNGDGLPDIVEACAATGEAAWTVWLNRGSGFGSAQRWNTGAARIREERNSGETTRDVFDVDGDGLADFVDFVSDAAKALIERNATGAWRSGGSVAELNAYGGRPDLLVQMENGLGGSTFLEYLPSTIWDNTDSSGVPHLPWVQWTVTRIERDDGLCEPGGTLICTPNTGAHTLSTQIDYGFGRYEALAREFRGFRTVRETDALAATRDTFFHQDAARRGKAQAVNRRDRNGALLGADVSAWQCVGLQASCAADASACPPLADCPRLPAPAIRVWARLVDSLHYDTTDGVIRKVSGFTNSSWDAYGNVTRTSRGGSGTAAVETLTAFLHDDSPRRYVVDRAASVEVVEPGGAASARRLQATWYAYDDLANVSTVSKWLDQVVDPGLPAGAGCPGGFCARSELRYDAFGNVVETIDANGRSTWTTYDDRIHLYPTAVRDALNQVVGTTYDPACGTLLARTERYWFDDANAAHPETIYAYDTHCRLASVRRPGEPETRPSARYTHRLGQPGRASAVEVETLVSSTRTTQRRDLFDALGRKLQSQRDAVVKGKKQVAVEDTRLYDARGRVSQVYSPFLLAKSDGVYAEPPGGGVTRTEYDDLDRVVLVQQPDGSAATTEHHTAWQSSRRDACTTSGACAGATVTERRDAFGRVVETEVADGESFGGATRSRYDGLGRVVATMQAAAPGNWSSATTVTFEYDSLGRRIRVIDPDSGTWRYGYDLGGNLVFVDDPAANQHLAYCYDAIGRVTDKFYGNDDRHSNVCGIKRGQVAYQYDAHDRSAGLDAGFDPRAAVGRLTRVDDGSGHTATFYDTLGRTKLVATTVVPPGQPATTSVVRFKHDVADHVVAISYPDGEVVKYSFDAVGQVRSVHGNQRYVRKLTYDVFGHPLELRHGNGVSDLRNYAGPTGNFRLTLSESTRGASALQRQVYWKSNANGLIEEIQDVGPTGGRAALNRSAVMAYDGQGRLTLWAGAADPQPKTYEYDLLGNLVRKDGLTFTYGPNRPHTLASIDGNVAGIVHDANGNRLGKPGFVYEFDQDDRLVGVGHDAVQFLYDHAGRRVAMAQGPEWTRYYGNLSEAAGGFLTKYYHVGSMLVASQRVANAALSARSGADAIRLAGSGAAGNHGLHVVLHPDTATATGIVLAIVLAATAAVPGRRRPVVGIAIRRRWALVLVVVWIAGTLPLPIVLRPAAAQSAAHGEVRHYHLDHLGSTQMVTDRRGQVLMHVRYAPFGQVTGYFSNDGTPLGGACGGPRSCREFTGYESEPVSGLQYAGARFYDPQLGMFLSHDPARQFASPYAYAGWNPTNRTDANGEFVVEFLAAVVLAALASAPVNAVVVAAQRSSLAQVGQAAAAGAVTGAVSVGIGVVVSGVGVSLALAAGNLPANVGLQEALNALGDVAYRSALSGVLSNAAGRAAGAAGVPNPAVSGMSALGGYLGSWGYDEWFAGDGWGGLGEEWPMIRSASNSETHETMTGSAARAAGFSRDETRVLVDANLEQDGPSFGWKTLNNENHFGAAAAAAQRANDAAVSGPATLSYAGAASHFLQDQYALGHLAPGSEFFAGIAGAPMRNFLHQAIGGEVNFFRMSGGLRVLSASDATFEYFEGVRGRVSPAGWM